VQTFAKGLIVVAAIVFTRARSGRRETDPNRLGAAGARGTAP